MQMSHKNTHRSLQHSLPKILHTIQRNGIYHYKKRLNSTFVQCSLGTRDPVLAAYYVKQIEMDLMSRELEEKEIVRRVKQRVKRKKSAGCVQVHFPQSEIRIDERGNPIFDYGGDQEKEMNALITYKKMMGELGTGGGGGVTKFYCLQTAIGEFIKFYAKYREWSPGTLKLKKSYMQRYFNYISTNNLFEIDEDRHNNYGFYLLNNIGAGTANQELAAVNLFVKYMRKTHKITLLEVERVPEKTVKKQKTERITFRPNDIPVIAECLEYLTPQQRLIIVLCFCVGARVGEIGQIELNDIKVEGSIHYINITNEDEDEDEPEEFIIKRKTVKTLNSKRFVPIPDALIDYILKLKEKAQPKKGKTLFYNVNNNVSGGRGGNASQVFIRRLREFGFGKEYVTHSARYMFKNVVHKPCDEAYTEKVMGHASQKTGRSVYLEEELNEMLTIVNFATNKHMLPLIAVLNNKQIRKTYTKKADS